MWICGSGSCTCILSQACQCLEGFPKSHDLCKCVFCSLADLAEVTGECLSTSQSFFLGTRRSTCTYVSSLGLYLLCLCLWQWPVQSNMTWGLSTCGQSFEFRCSCFGPWEQWHHDERTACLCAWLLWVSGWGLFFAFTGPCFAASWMHVGFAHLLFETVDFGILCKPTRKLAGLHVFFRRSWRNWTRSRKAVRQHCDYISTSLMFWLPFNNFFLKVRTLADTNCISFDISTKHQGLCLLQSTEIVLNFLHQSLWQVFA